MNQSRIFRAWAPLEAAWLLMAAEGPFIAAVIARLAEPKLNLAAFGVAFPFAMLFESPIILIMSASAALVVDRDSFLKLRRFAWGLNAAVTVALALFVLPLVFDAVALRLMSLPPEVAWRARIACTLLLPWPAAIGYRRFYQGILVRHGLTRRIAYGTAIRLGNMGATALLLGRYSAWPGVWVGAAALSVGVVLEAAASRLWARSCVRDLMAKPHEGPGLTFASITHFYVPLALTSILALGVNPLVSFFLGHSAMPLESLAVMPVVNSFIFIFSTAGLTFQEVAIPLMDQGDTARQALRRFALGTAALSAGILLLVAFSPLGRLWFESVLGLAPTLANFALLPVAILSVQPALTVLLAYLRAQLVVERRTRPISWATALEVVTIAITLLTLTRAFGWIGATAAACALVAGRAVSGVFLWPRTKPQQ